MRFTNIQISYINLFKSIITMVNQIYKYKICYPTETIDCERLDVFFMNKRICNECCYITYMYPCKYYVYFHYRTACYKLHYNTKELKDKKNIKRFTSQVFIIRHLIANDTQL